MFYAVFEKFEQSLEKYRGGKFGYSGKKPYFYGKDIKA